MESDVMDHGETALATVSRESGAMSLAMLTETDFEARLVAMKLGQERIRRIQRELMVGPTAENPEGEDFGIIPGTKKPTLLKPGAEKICLTYGLVPSFEREWKYGDGVSAPHLRIEMTCYLHRGSKLGPIVGEGVGAANSWEKKHRYRAAQRACPECGTEGTIRRSNKVDEEGDRGYYCFGKIGGCGANFYSTDKRITQQQAGQVDNPDPYDVENNLLKMAAKRAQVDAVLRATATSGLFTQDVEDTTPPEGSTSTPREEQTTTSASTHHAPPPPPPPPPPTKPPEAGALPRWLKPCPKCGVTGAVMASKRNPGSYYCFPKSSRGQGCGYEFTPGGVQ